MRVGIVADDLTGAADSGALCRRRGMSVGLTLGLPRVDEAGADIEIAALKIRSVQPDEAVDVARQAAGALHAAGCDRLFWKYCSTFDSTPEGNIGPVADMLMEFTGTDYAVHCPAFPQNGRTVYKGRLFVGDVPLDESPMRDHPLTPMRDASLLRLLAPQTRRAISLASLETLRAGRFASRLGHVVADAIEDEDLARLASLLPPNVLRCGSSAFAAALLVPRGAPSALPVMPPGPALILSGSCSEATCAQLAAFEAAGGAVLHLDPEQLARNGPGAAAAWARAHLGAPACVAGTAPPEARAAACAALGSARAAALIEEALAAAASAAQKAGTRRFVIAGGETSGAVAAALGLSRLELGEEIAPGVPWAVATGTDPVAVVTKSGNFGDADFFGRAIRVMEAA